MRDRATALTVPLALALGIVACSGSAEKNVVNQYFNALRANDTATLTSFAMVQFDQQVQDFSVLTVGPETRTPAPLAGLVEKQKDLEAQAAANTREARTWGNDLAIYPKLDQVRELERNKGKIPPALQPIHEKWQAFNAKDRELKAAAAAAKQAVEREKRNVVLSVGEIENVETLTGEMIAKDVDLELTIGGEKKPYLMTLRKYELAGNTGGRMLSRWVVQSLEPKG